jgi:hypothetical protein
LVLGNPLHQGRDEGEEERTMEQEERTTERQEGGRREEEGLDEVNVGK